MIEVSFCSKKPFWFWFSGLFFIFFWAPAQEQKSIPDIEKIYLHTDRNVYFTGEDLWYKAYVVRASNNLLFDKSNILYVELISSNSDIIIRNKTSLEMGLGHGDFQLQDSLDVKPGKYQLRAYTNWNRNFGNDFVFTKDIEIIDIFESKETAKTSKKAILETKKSKNEVLKQNPYKVDFFPEGGSLIENLASVVGFKAVDTKGKPIDIKGEIYDSDNGLVTTFESVHDGVGKLQMLPIEGKSYYAKIKNGTGVELRQQLPKILKQGYALSFRNFKGKYIVTINTNQATLAQNPNPQLMVVCKSRGISYLETAQALTETTLSFELPKDEIPDGISQITLFDNVNKPQSERLVYFEKDHDLEVQLSIDKTSYQPEEKVTLNVSSKSKSGEGKSASFSLSVTDTNGVEEDNYDSNICSYFLMESDIRGKVYRPAYYFDSNNLKRLEHLDNLLLTQGWRDFVWKTLPKIDEKNSYKIEKGITVSGRVKQLFADKPLVNNNLTLALMSKKNHGFFNTVTDSIGRFKFENLEFSGKATMYLNTRDEKGKGRGEIVLDSIERSPMHISFKKEQIILPESINTVAENVMKKFIAFGVKPENILKEVEVIAKKKRPFIVPHGIPSYTYQADDKTAGFFDVFDILKEFVPFYKIDYNELYNPENGIFLDDSNDVFKIDDNEASLTEVIAISPYEIEKIEVVEDFLPGIYIYTNRYKNLGKPLKRSSLQSVKKDLEGYYTARTFYSPNPENPNPELEKNAAVRNTIYWNPYIHPDKSGSATVDFYNSKVETKIKLALEGITASGIPVVKTSFYSVKK